jgi:hypothetical protein
MCSVQCETAPGAVVPTTEDTVPTKANQHARSRPTKAEGLKLVLLHGVERDNYEGAVNFFGCETDLVTNLDLVE